MKLKPRLVIAGPGSGKTSGLVDEVVACIRNVKSCRVLAAITYTNAAADSIKTKLEKTTKLPANIFLGTTYSFFNAFILLPFASLFGIAGLDAIFVEYNVFRRAEEIAKGKGIGSAQERFRYQKAIETNILKRLLSNGVIPFEQIASISAELMKNRLVRSRVGNRIEYLFVDEFQDATAKQYAVFDALRKEGKTIIYSVGDPEQYISNYTIRGQKRPAFEKIPIMAFQSYAEVQRSTRNHRSSLEIVGFINNFNTQIKQLSTVGSVDDGGVFFISNTDLERTIEAFLGLTQHLDQEVGRTRFFLAFANNAYDPVRAKFGLGTISNDKTRPPRMLLAALRLIFEFTGLSAKQLAQKYSLNAVGMRMLGMRLLKSSIRDEAALKSFLEVDLGLVRSEHAEISTLVECLNHVKEFAIDKSINVNLTASIHKSKGLEADAVLVLARGNKELSSWLEVNPTIRFSDKRDDYRLGFVAFSRAKRVLAIACMKPLDTNNRKKLDRFGVRII